MSQKQTDDLHLRIEMILSSSRREEEGFLINNKDFAQKLIDYMKTENLLATEVSVFEISY